jgi:hypothetical protein
LRRLTVGLSAAAFTGRRARVVVLALFSLDNLAMRILITAILTL